MSLRHFYLSGNLIGSYVMNVYDCYYAGDGSYPAPGCTTSITFEVSLPVSGCCACNYDANATTDCDCLLESATEDACGGNGP